MNIVLIGFMCAGKSRIGRTLAQRLGWKFFDTDKMVSDKTGQSVAELIRTKGEDVFRHWEQQMISDVSVQDCAVIATGGGVPLNSDNIAQLKKQGQLVWLKVQPETVLKRMGQVHTRPLIDPSRPLESISERLKQREPFYAIAPYSVETDHSDPDSTVQQILSFFPDLNR